MALTDDERDQLRTAARSLLGRDSSSERVRAAIATEPGFDRGLWQQMVELGWTAIAVAEEHGGAGCGYADLAVVVQEQGRALTPSPLLASAVLASGVLSQAPNLAVAAELLAPMASGDALGAVAFASATGSYDQTQLSMRWRTVGSTVRLDGSAAFVLDADVADVLIVAALDENGAAAAVPVPADAPGVRIERTPPVDHTRRLFTVSLEGVVVGEDRLLADPGGASSSLMDQALALGVVGVACDSAGVADRVLELAAEHAKDRVQFGRPIGTFQAVKHHCANMAIETEASRAAAEAAAAALDGDPAGWAQAAAIAASFVGPASSRVCALGLLVHGGIGFTWEHDCHLLLKRAKLNELLFGTPRWHRLRLADRAFPTGKGER